jgi:hypothetical protein
MGTTAPTLGIGAAYSRPFPRALQVMVRGPVVQEHQGLRNLFTHLPRRVQPKVRTNSFQLEMVARHLKEEMHTTKAARRAALDAKRLRQEACGSKNVH